MLILSSKDHWGKYGDVVGTYTFGHWTVHLFSYDAIYEALVKNSDSFSERPKGKFSNSFPQPGQLTHKVLPDGQTIKMVADFFSFCL